MIQDKGTIPISNIKDSHKKCYQYKEFCIDFRNSISIIVKVLFFELQSLTDVFTKMC